MPVTREQLAQRRALPLEDKVAWSEMRIREWYDHWHGQVYVGFSGGKDSTVLRDIVKRLYPHVPAVFSDTGLEYPEVREFALSKADEVIRPNMTFKQVIERYGYPVVGKRQAEAIHTLRHPTEKNENTRRLLLTGYTKDGRYMNHFKLPEKWRYLVNAPFESSHRCCDALKEWPFEKYERKTGRHPILGLMAEESLTREKSYLKFGCNAWEWERPKSMPLGFWTEQDILQYIKTRNLEYASIYGDIVEKKNGTLALTGWQRTGCMFCLFGIQFDGTPNRFQRMAETHPKQYEYCMNQLGIKDVLTYMGIPYE